MKMHYLGHYVKKVMMGSTCSLNWDNNAAPEFCWGNSCNVAIWKINRET